MEKLKDHKEIKVDQTQIEGRQVWLGPGQVRVSDSPPLLLPRWQAILLQQRTGQRSHILSPSVCHLPGIWTTCGLWARTNDSVGKNIPLISNNVSFGKGMAQMPPECRPIQRRAVGRERWGTMGGHGRRKLLAFGS